jgi:uncharacterized protein GlcG (DUF336 family)
VFVDKECVGGIGVAGGDQKQDEEIARTALQSIEAKWE